MLRGSSCASVFAATIVASAIGACSLFVDTDGLQDSTDGSDASIPTSDGSSLDGAIPKDGSTLPDGAPLPDAGPTPFCASHPGHSLCLDFDESTDLPAVDDSSFDPGHLFIDTVASVSPSQSLAVVFSPGNAANESLGKNLPLTKGGLLSVALDVRYTASDLTQGQTIAFSIDVPHAPGLADHFFYLQTYFDNFDLAETVQPDDGGISDFPSNTLRAPVPADTWMHVEMTVDGSSRVWTLSIDGAALASTQAEVGFPSGPVHVSLGGYGSAQLPVSTTIHIDNVLIDY